MEAPTYILCERIMAQSGATCQELQPETALKTFRERLPRKPYHADSLGEGLRVRDVKKAIAARHIQPNGPTHRHWLVYDVDRMTAALDWNDLGAPPPNLVVQNPANGHAHLLYGFEVPIRTAPDSRNAPLRYAAAVDCALRAVLGADEGYSGLICKNPLNSHWRVTEWEPNLYTLGDLDSWLDLSAHTDRRKRLPDYGLGRNCTLFEKLRLWAYRAIRQGWPDADRWYEAVLTRARGYNDFEVPLSDNEVKNTARSVARYTHRNMSQAGFNRWQSAQGYRGGIRSGVVRREGSEAERQPWVALGISRATYYRRKRRGEN